MRTFYESQLKILELLDIEISTVPKDQMPFNYVLSQEKVDPEFFNSIKPVLSAPESDYCMLLEGTISDDYFEEELLMLIQSNAKIPLIHKELCSLKEGFGCRSIESFSYDISLFTNCNDVNFEELFGMLVPKQLFEDGTLLGVEAKAEELESTQVYIDQLHFKTYLKHTPIIASSKVDIEPYLAFLNRAHESKNI